MDLQLSGPCRQDSLRRELLQRGFSRRDFGKIALLLGGSAATLPFYGEAALAQLSQVKNIPPDAVKINANENPLGPAPEAIEAMQKVLAQGGRYAYNLTDEFRETLAAQSGLSSEHVLPFAGSSTRLTQAVLAFTSPTRSFVVCRPRLRSRRAAAKFIGAKTVKRAADQDAMPTTSRPWPRPTPMPAWSTSAIPTTRLAR